MARGRLLKTQVKEARQITEAISVGSQKAESKKDFWLSIKEHIGKFVDRVDPIELSAILALTLVIHDTYDWTALNLSRFKFRSGLDFLGLTRKAGSTEIAKLGEFLADIPDPLVWLISFISAFYVLRHGKDMLSAVTSVIGMLGLV